MAIGKINDIFSGQGISRHVKGTDSELFEHLVTAGETMVDGSLTFANFVEFDSLFGHRRDVAGYARALEWFDGCLPRFLSTLRPGDLAIFTADHGNDPTWVGVTPATGSVVGFGLGVKGGLVGLPTSPIALPRILGCRSRAQGDRFYDRHRNIPKVELHLHLEGGAAKLIQSLSKQKGIDLSGLFTADGGYKYQGFGEFLKVYEAACTVLTAPEDFYQLTKAVLAHSASQGVVYSDIHQS